MMKAQVLIIVLTSLFLNLVPPRAHALIQVDDDQSPPPPDKLIEIADTRDHAQGAAEYQQVKRQAEISSTIPDAPAVAAQAAVAPAASNWSTSKIAWTSILAVLFGWLGWWIFKEQFGTT